MMGGDVSIVYGVVWQTVTAIGPPNSTLFNARTVMKYFPSERVNSKLYEFLNESLLATFIMKKIRTSYEH